jgi:acetylornithine deacetylase
MRVVTAHKSMFIFDTHVDGFEAHSSKQNLGVPAVMVAGRLVNWLAEQQDRNREGAAGLPVRARLFHPALRGDPGRHRAEHHGAALPLRHRHPHPAGRRSHGLLFAPWSATPGKNSSRRCAACIPTPASVSTSAPRCPAFTPAKTNPRCCWPSSSPGQNSTESVAYGAEAGQFQRAGLSVAMCGPGSIDQAHQPNEYISVEQFEQGVVFMRRLIDHLSA